MRKGMFVRSILGLALVSLVSSLQASTITIGGTPLAGTGNCDPFGCPQFFGLGTYQQVYSSSAFSGQSTIEGITFYDDQVENGAIPAGGTFTLSFSYTSNSPNALDLASPSANIDSASQTFYGGVLPSLSGNMLTFSENPFVYNPAFGDLPALSFGDQSRGPAYISWINLLPPHRRPAPTLATLTESRLPAGI